MIYIVVGDAPVEDAMEEVGTVLAAHPDAFVVCVNMAYLRVPCHVIASLHHEMYDHALCVKGFDGALILSGGARLDMGMPPLEGISEPCSGGSGLAAVEWCLSQPDCELVVVCNTWLIDGYQIFADAWRRELERFSDKVQTTSKPLQRLLSAYKG